MAGPDPTNGGPNNGPGDKEAPKVVSLESLAILGITHEQAVAKNLKPMMMSYEDGLETNKALLEKRGMSEEDYANVYNGVLQNQKNKAQKGYFETQANPIQVSKALTAPLPESALNPERWGVTKNYKQFIGKDTKKAVWRSEQFDNFGNSFRTENKDQEAAGYNMYIDQEGNAKRIDEYTSMDYLGRHFRMGEDGKKKMLVIGTSDKFPGANVYVEVNAGEVQKYSNTRSMFGPQEETSSAIRNFADQAFNTVIDQIVGTSGTLAEVIGHSMDLWNGDGKTGVWTEWGREMQNKANISKSKISEHAEKQGWNDSLVGFAGVAGSAGAQVMMMLTSSRMFGALGTALKSAKAGQMIGQGASYMLGAGYAAHAMNQEGIEMGLEDTDRLLLALGAGTVTMMAERALDAMGATGFINRISGEKTKKELVEESYKKYAKEALSEHVEALRNASTEAEKAVIRSKIIQGTTEKVYKKFGILKTPFNMMKAATKKAVAMGGKGKPIRNIVSGMAEEGAEEWIELWGNTGLKFIHDNVRDENGKTVGNGLFGAHLPSMEEQLDNIAGGAIGGAIGGGIRSLGKYDERQEISDHVYSEMALNYTFDEAKAIIEKYHAEGALDNPLLTEEDDLIAALPKDVRGEAKSKNDVALQTALQQLQLAFNTKAQLGISDANGKNNAEFIAKNMGGDNALATEALKLSMSQTYYGSAHAKLGEKMATMDKESSEYKHAEKELKELETIMADKKARYTSILDGSLYSQYQANQVSNSAMFNQSVVEEMNNIDKGKGQQGMSPRQKAKDSKDRVNTVMAVAMENLEQNPSYNDQHRAYVTNQTLQNLSVEQVRTQAEVAKAREEDKGDSEISDKLQELTGMSDMARSDKSQDYNSIIDSVSELNVQADEKGGFTASQADTANKILRDANKYAMEQLDSIKKAAENITVKEGEQKPTFEPDAYASMADVLGAESPYTRDEAAALVQLNEGTLAKHYTGSAKKAKESIYMPEGKTVTNKRKHKEFTHLLEEVDISDAGQPIYKKTDKDGNVFLISRGEFLAKPDKEFKYEEIKDENKMVVTTFDKFDETGKPTYKSRIVEGRRMTAEQHAMSTAIRMSSTGKTFDKELASLEQNIRAGVISPSPEVLEKIKDLKREIQNRFDAIQLVRNLKKLQQRGYKIPDNAKRSMGWATWGNTSFEELDMNLALLDGARKQAILLQQHVIHLTDKRDSVFKEYSKQNLKINAETHNVLSKHFNGEAFYINDKNEKVPLKRPTLDPESDEITESQIAQSKQYWHVYFNTTDEQGTYVNLVKESDGVLLVQKAFRTFIQEEMVGLNKGEPNRNSDSGMFSTSLDDYTLERFRQNHEMRLDNASDKGTFFREAFLYNYIQGVIGANPFTYNSGLLDVLDKPVDGKITAESEQKDTNDKVVFTGAHNAEQLTNLEFLDGFLMARARTKEDPKFALALDEVINRMYYGGMATRVKKSRRNNNKHIIVVPGNAGAGKTTYVTNTLLNIAKNTLGNVPIILVAPTQIQLDNLAKGADRAGITNYKKVIFSEFKDTYKTEKDSVIVLDEYTLIDSVELDPIIKNNGTMLDSSNTMFVLGDQAQSPPKITKGAASVNAYMQNTLNLATPMRTGVVDIANMQGFFRAKVEGIIGDFDPISFSTKHNIDGENWTGVKRYDTWEEMQEDALARVNSGNATLIVFDEADKQAAIADKFTGTIKIMSDTEQSPQGADIAEVFVYIPTEKSGGPLRKNPKLVANALHRYMLTAVSRAETFLGIVMPGAKSEAVPVEEIEKSSPDADKLRKDKVDLYKKVEEIVDNLIPNISNTKLKNGAKPAGKTVYPTAKVEPVAPAVTLEAEPDNVNEALNQTEPESKGDSEINKLTEQLERALNQVATVQEQLNDDSKVLEKLEEDQKTLAEQAKKLSDSLNEVEADKKPISNIQKTYGIAYKQKNDKSGLVEITTSIKEKDGITYVSFKTKTANKKGDTKHQNHKSYNTVEELISDLNLTDKNSISSLHTLNEGIGTLGIKQIRIKDGIISATLLVGGGKMEVNLSPKLTTKTKTPTPIATIEEIEQIVVVEIEKENLAPNEAIEVKSTIIRKGKLSTDAQFKKALSILGKAKKWSATKVKKVKSAAKRIWNSVNNTMKIMLIVGTTFSLVAKTQGPNTSTVNVIQQINKLKVDKKSVKYNIEKGPRIDGIPTIFIPIKEDEPIEGTSDYLGVFLLGLVGKKEGEQLTEEDKVKLHEMLKGVQEEIEANNEAIRERKEKIAETRDNLKLLQDSLQGIDGRIKSLEQEPEIIPIPLKQVGDEVINDKTVREVNGTWFYVSPDGETTEAARSEDTPPVEVVEVSEPETEVIETPVDSIIETGYPIAWVDNMEGQPHIQSITLDGFQIARGLNYLLDNGKIVTVNNIREGENGNVLDYTPEDQRTVYSVPVEEFAGSIDNVYRKNKDWQAALHKSYQIDGQLSVLGHYTTGSISEEGKIDKKTYFEGIKRQNKILAWASEQSGMFAPKYELVAIANETINHYDGSETVSNVIALRLKSTSDVNKALGRSAEKAVSNQERTLAVYPIDAPFKDVEYKALLQGLFNKANDKLVDLEYTFTQEEVGNLDKITVQPAYFFTGEKVKGEGSMTLKELMEDANNMGISTKMRSDDEIDIIQKKDEERTLMVVQLGRKEGDYIDVEIQSKKIQDLKSDGAKYLNDLETDLNTVADKLSMRGEELADYTHFWTYNMNQINVDAKNKLPYVNELVKAGVLYQPKGYVEKAPAQSYDSRAKKALELRVFAKDNGKTVWKEETYPLLIKGLDILRKAMASTPSVRPNVRISTHITKKGEGVKEIINKDILHYFDVVNQGAVLSGITSVAVDPGIISKTLSGAKEIDTDNPNPSWNKMWSKGPSKYTKSEYQYDVVKEDANQIILNILGEEYIKEYGGFKFGRTTFDEAGEQIHGFITGKGAMTLNQLKNGTISPLAAYHETIHFIEQFLLKDGIKDELHAEIAKKTTLVGLNASEYLAEMGAAYMNDRANLTGWSKKFQAAVDWLSNQFRNIGRLLGMRNAMSDFFYQVHSTNDFVMSPNWKDTANEPNFDIMYAKDRVASYEPVKNAFPSHMPNLAFHATRQVIYSMADSMTRAKLDVSDLTGTSYNFDKIIGDLEYEWRSKALVNLIKANPMIDTSSDKAKNKGHQKAEMPYFTYDASSTIENIGDLKNLKYLNKNFEYVEALPDNKGRWFNKDKKTRTNFRRIIRDKLHNTQTGAKGYNLPYNETKEVYGNLTSGKDQENYVAYTTLDDKVFFGIIQQWFPGINLGNPKNQKGGFFYDEDRAAGDFRTWMDQNQKVSDSVSKKENAQTSPMERVSDLIKFAISTLPLPKIVSKNGSLTEEFTENQFVDPDEVNYIMENAGEDSYVQVASELNLSDVEIFAKRIKSLVKEYEATKDTNTALEGNTNVAHTWAIYDRYFTTNKLSHFAIVQMWKYLQSGLTKQKSGNKSLQSDGVAMVQEVYDMYKTIAPKSGSKIVGKQEFIENMQSLQKVSNRILNALVVHYKNVGATEYITVAVNGKNKRVKKVNAANLDEQQYKVMEDLKGSLIDNENDVTAGAIRLYVNGLNPSTRKSLAKTASKTVISEDGIGWRTVVNGTHRVVPIVGFNRKNGTFTNLLAKDKDGHKYDKKTIVSQLFSELGIKIPYRVKAELSTGRFGDRIGFEDFIPMIGQFAASSYVYANENTEEGKKNNADTAASIKDFLRQHVGNNVYGQGTIGEINEIGNREASDQDQEGEATQFFPSLFKTEIGQLSELMLRATGGRYTKFIYNVNNKKVMLTTVTNAMRKHFRKGQSTSMAKKFKAQYGDQLNNLSTHNVMGGKILNPVLGNSKNGFIQKMMSIGGWKTKTGGVELSKMTERDNLDLYWEVFTDDLFGNFNKSNTAIPATNQSDRSLQDLYYANMRVDGLTKVDSNGFVKRTKLSDGSYSYALDVDTVLWHSYQNMLIQEKAQIASLNGWVTFMTEKNARGEAKFNLDGLNEIIEADPDNLEDLSRQRVESKALFYNVLNQVKSANLKDTDFFGYNMVSSHDYIIPVGKNAVGNYAQLGFDTTMNQGLNIAGLGKKKGISSTINSNSFHQKWSYNKDTDTYKLDATGGTIMVEILAKERENGGISEGGKRFLINQWFGKSLKAAHRLAADSGHVMPKGEYGTQKDKYVKAGIKNGNGKFNDIWTALVVGHQLVNDYVQFATDSTYAHEANSYVNTDTRSPVRVNANQNKRGSIKSSPMFTPNTGGFNDVDKISNYLILEDPKLSRIIKNAFGKNFNESVEAFDGMGYKNPLVAELMYRSMGEEWGMMNGTGMTKQTANQVDMGTGRIQKRKYALDSITADSLKWMPQQEKMLELMLNPTGQKLGSLYHVYEKELLLTGSHQEAISKTADFYTEQRFKYEVELKTENPYKLLSSMVFKSGVKQQSHSNVVPFSAPFDTNSKNADPKTKNLFNINGVRHNTILDAYQNGLGNDIYRYTHKFDHTQEGIQLNANKQISNIDESPMTQMLSLVFASPEQNDNGQTVKGTKLLMEVANHALTDFFNVLEDSKQDLVDKLIKLTPEEFSGLEEMNFDIDVSKGELQEVHQLEQMMMGFAYDGLSNSNDGSVLSRLISERIEEDGSFANSIDFAGVKTRAYQYLAAYMRDKVIKRKMKGMRLVLSSGNLIEMIEYVDPVMGTKSTFSIDEAMDFAERLGIPFNVESASNPAAADLLHKAQPGIFVRKPLDNYEVIETPLDQLPPAIRQEMEQFDINFKTQKLALEAGIARVDKALVKKNVTEGQKTQLYTEKGTIQAALNRVTEDHSNARYKKMRDAGQTKVQLGQTLLPAARLEQYGIPRTTSLSQVFRIWESPKEEGGKWVENNLVELATKKDRSKLIDAIKELAATNITIKPKKDKYGNTVGIQVVSLPDSNIKPGINPVWDTMVAKMDFEIQPKLKAKLDPLYRRIKREGGSDSDFKAARDVITQNAIYLAEEALEGMADALIGINDSLLSLSVHTPSGPGSGYLANVVGFINDNGSTAYFNSLKNTVTGTDYDIDQDTVYMNNPTDFSLGKPGAVREIGDISNDILEFVQDFYKNPRNDGMTQAPTTTEPLERSGDSAFDKKFRGHEQPNDLALSIEYRVSTNDGKVVGPFQMAQKAMTMLYTASRYNGGGILNTNILDDSGEHVLTYLNNLEGKIPGTDVDKYQNLPVNIEVIGNGAMDNAKLQRLGVINISFNNASLVSSGFLLQDDVINYLQNNGYTPDDEYDAVFSFLASNAHKDVAKKMKADRNVNNLMTIGESTFATSIKILDDIQKNKDKMTHSLANMKANSSKYIDELRDKLTSLGFSEEEFTSMFKLDENGEYKYVNWNKYKDLNRKVAARLLAIADEHAQSEEEDAQDSELDDTTSGQLANEGEYDANEKGEKHDLTKEFTKRITNLRYRLGYNQKRIKDIERKMSKRYQDDLFMVAKYAMMGDWTMRVARIVDINQGTKVSEYEMDRYKKNVEFMTGQSLPSLVKQYEAFVKAKEADAKATPINWLSEHGPKVDVIADKAFQQYRHRLAGDNFSWMNFNVHGGETVKQIKGKPTKVMETLNYRNQFHKIGNFTAALFARPDIMTYIKAAAIQDYSATKVFSTSLPVVRATMDKYLERAGKDNFNERQWNTFTEELDAFYVSDFFFKAEGMFQDTLEDLNGISTRPLLSDPTNKVGIKLDLTTTTGRRAFVLGFGKYFQDEISPNIYDDLPAPSQKLLDQLEVRTTNGVGYLMFKGLGNDYGENEIIELQTGFNNLPKEVREILVFYQIAKDGFQYKAGTFAKVIDTSMHKKFSEHMRTIKENEYGYSKDFYDNMEVFLNTLSSLPQHNLLRGEQGIQGLKGKEYGPPKAAYGLAKNYYSTVNIQWSSFGMQKTLAFAKLLKQSGMGWAKSAGNSIALGPNATKKERLAPQNIINPENGMSMLAEFHMIHKGMLGKEVDRQLKLEAGSRGRELTKEEVDAKFDELTARVNELALQRKFHTDVYHNFQNTEADYSYISTDEDGKELTNYAEMRTDLYETYKGMYLDAIKRDNTLLTDLPFEENKIFVDKSMNSVISPAYIMSMIANEYQMHLQKHTEEGLTGDLAKQAALNELYLMRLSDDQITPAYEYEHFRNQSGSLANAYSPIDDGMINMQKDVFNKKILPFFERNLPEGESGIEDNARIALNKYAIAKELNGNQSLPIGEIQSLLNGIFKTNSFTDRIKNSNIDQWHTALETPANWVEYNVDTDRMLLHASKLMALRDAQIDAASKGIPLASVLNMPSLGITLKRKNKHIMKVGDMVNFSDGNVGVITALPGVKTVKTKKGFTTIAKNFRYVLLPSKSKATNYVQHSVPDIADHTHNANARKGLKAFVNLMARALPNIQFKYINQEQARKMGQGVAYSFFKDGVVHINTDKASRGTALHEFGHPLALALENDNPQVFKALADGIRKTPLLNHVKRLYPHLKSERDINLELIPQFLEKAYNKKDSQGLFRKAMNWFKGFMKKLVGLGNQSAINALNMETATIQNIADAIVSDMMDGKQMSNITTAEAAALMPYTAMSAAATDGGPLTMLHIDKMHKTMAGEHGQANRKKVLENRIWYILNNKGDSFVGPSGKVYHLGKDLKIDKLYAFRKNGAKKGEFLPERRNDYIAKVVIKEELPFMEKPAPLMIDFLNGTANKTLVASAMNSFRKGWKSRFKPSSKDYKTNIAIKEQRLQEMMDYIGFSHKYDIATSLSDTKELAKYGLSLDPSMIGENPMVIIHDAKNSAGKLKRVSIVYVTNENMKHAGISILPDGNTTTHVTKQGASYLTKEELKKVSITNRVRDINSSKATLQAMALKQSNPDIHIQNVGTLGIYGDAKDSKGFKAHLKPMKDTVKQVNVIYGSDRAQDRLDPAIRLVVKDKAVSDPKTYKLNILQAIRQYAQTKMNEVESSKNITDIKATHIFESMLEASNSYEEKYRGTYGVQLAKLILTRMNYMRMQELADDPTAIYRNEEYQELADMYRQFMDRDAEAEMPVRELGWMEKWMQTADRFDDDIRTWIFQEINIGLNRAKEIELNFVDKNNEHIAILQHEAKVLKHTSDQSRALFESLYIKKEVPILGSNGKLTGKTSVVTTMEIHWDENNDVTRQAIATGHVTPSQVKYGKFLMDSFEYEFVEYIHHKDYIQHTKGMKGATTKEKREASREAAKEKVAQRWKKGMLPTMSRRFTAAMADGDKKEALQLFMGNVSRQEGAFEEHFEGETTPNAVRHKKINSHFWGQFKNSADNGSDQRLLNMGLVMHNGELVLLDKANQRNLSYNLESIGNYTIGASARARSLDDAVDAVNVAMDLLNGMAVKKGINTTAIIDQMKIYANRNIFGQLPIHGKVILGSTILMADDLIHAANTLGTNIALAASPVLAAKNFVATQIKMWSNGLANSWVKNRYFGYPDIQAAVTEVLTNPSKVSAINRKYLLVDMAERDILNHALYNRTRRHIQEGDAMFAGHFAGDHINKLIGSVAQMIKDGTYYAHDEKGNYDYTKDKRFHIKYESVNGKLKEIETDHITDDGRLIMETVKMDLVREKLLNQHMDEDGPLKGAYASRHRDRIKVLVNRFVADITDNQYKNMSNAYGLVKMSMSLKNYLTNVGHEWFQRTHKEKSIGRDIIIEKDGKKKVVWEQPLVEGVAITIFSTLKKMREMRGNPQATWDDMSDYQKRNLAKLITFSIGALSIYAIVNAILGDDEDEEEPTTAAGYLKRGAKVTARKILTGGVQEQLTQINPYQGIIEWRKSPTTIIKQFENTEKALVANLVLPFGIYEDGFGVAIREWLMAESKLTPGGALWRDADRFSGDFILSLLNSMENK